jgi:hypothetical protein
MNESSPSNSSTHRPVLKLKIAARKSPREAKTPPPRPQSKLTQKPGAAWVSRTSANATTVRSGWTASGAGERSKADEFNRRMQEDMDALLTR